MRDRHEEFERRGAEVIAIGLGSVEEARAFSSRYRLPFRVLTDPNKLSYQAVGLNRAGWNAVIGPTIWRSGLRALLRGRGIGRPKQDPLQLGGSAVILAGGELALLHRDADSADDPSVEDLIRALG